MKGSDLITTILGAIAAALNQFATVGAKAPETSQEWLYTGLSALLAALGFFTNKVKPQG